MSYSTLLFDLDGTLTDPYDGITNAIRYALKEMQRPCPAPEILRRFIGPPLTESFERYCKMTKEESAEALRLYRVYFSKIGLFENIPYPGVAQLLTELKAAGYKIALATSKPEPFALRILEHFGLLASFDIVRGSLLDGGRPAKADVIACVLEDLRADKAHCLMIGDRIHDMEGAKACGIDALGVLYGYGPKEEFGSAVFIAKDIRELGKYLLNQ